MKSRCSAKILLAPVIGTMFSFSAYAAVTAGDLAPITAEITADIAVILPYAFGILAIVLAAIIGFKLVKKFTGSAT